MKTLTVGEHDTVVRGEETGYFDLPTLGAEAFDAVAALVSDAELFPIASLTYNKNRLALKLTQWVGVLRTPDGTALEVLPKLHRRGDDPGESRALLLKMLAAVDERFKIAPPADLDPARMPLFEVFLRYALEGFQAAVRRGVPHTYAAVQDERAGLRGKLDLSRQLRQLPHRAHLLHVAYDEYLSDRPENRLVRLSIERIASMTAVAQSKRLARELLLTLENVPPSQHVQTDFRAWRLERGYPHFRALEALCRLILFELNPLVNRARSTSFAVLFDMNRVYEAYVAQLLKRHFPMWTIQSQVTEYSLGVVKGQQVFSLRPDLLITLPDGSLVVADTKWKRLNPNDQPTYGVSNTDACQMLAYSEVFQQNYQKQHIWLIYPQVRGLPLNPVEFALPGGRILRLITLNLHEEAPFQFI